MLALAVNTFLLLLACTLSCFLLALAACFVCVRHRIKEWEGQGGKTGLTTKRKLQFTALPQVNTLPLVSSLFIYLSLFIFLILSCPVAPMHACMRK